MRCQVCGRKSDKLLNVLDRKLCPACEQAAWERIVDELKRIKAMSDEEFGEYLDAERKS